MFNTIQAASLPPGFHLHLLDLLDVAHARKYLLDNFSNNEFGIILFPSQMEFIILLAWS